MDKHNKIIIMPAYSIGKATKQPSFVYKNQTPGVGAYETNQWNKQSKIVTLPSPSMSRAQKFFSSLQKFQNVGPGSYNPQKTKTKIGPTLKGKHKDNSNKDVPSPDKYNTSIKFPTKQYSFGRASRRLKTEQCPGPGQYELKSTFMTNGTHFSRQSKQKIKAELIPGPGAYNESRELLASNKQFTFSKQRKFIASQAQQRIKGKMPGPGTYNISQLKKRFQGGKFPHAERVLFEKSDIPGPASYNSSQLLLKKLPQVVMGSQKKLIYKDNDIPGPGSYNIPKSQIFKKKDSYAVFLQQQRLKDYKTLAPGPGTYEQKKYQVRTISISPKTRNQRIQNIPGPQQYHPEYKNIKIKSPNPIFGHEDRMRRFKTQTPGPGQYKGQKLKISRTFHFGRAKKIQDNASTVGPGQYKLKPFIGYYDGIEKDTKQILYV